MLNKSTITGVARIKQSVYVIIILAIAGALTYVQLPDEACENVTGIYRQCLRYHPSR
jgi:hypothetical protein